MKQFGGNVLFLDRSDINTDEIKNWLKDNLNEERYIHTLGVSEAAEELAEMFNLNKEKADIKTFDLDRVDPNAVITSSYFLVIYSSKGYNLHLSNILAI